MRRKVFLPLLNLKLQSARCGGPRNPHVLPGQSIPFAYSFKMQPAVARKVSCGLWLPRPLFLIPFGKGAKKKLHTL